MDRDDREREKDDSATPNTDAPADGPAREPGEGLDQGSTSQDQPGGEP